MDTNAIVIALITVFGSIASTWGAIILNRRANGSASTKIMQLEQENAKLRAK